MLERLESVRDELQARADANPGVGAFKRQVSCLNDAIHFESAGKRKVESIASQLAKVEVREKSKDSEVPTE